MSSLPTGLTSNVLLDIVISLIAVFLLASLLTTAAQEIVARVLEMRAKMLKAAINGMLTQGLLKVDDAGALEKDAEGKNVKLEPKDATAFTSLFEGNPLIKALMPPNASLLLAPPSEPSPKGSQTSSKTAKNGRYPSYIPAAIFRSALLANSLVAGVDGDLKKAVENGHKSFVLDSLNTLAQQARGNVAAFEKSVETWFDAVMDRVNGSYKRWSQVMTFLIGLGVAGLCNIDAIRMTNHLLEHPQVAQEIAAAAAEFQKVPSLDPKTHAEKVSGIMRSAGAPIGWGNIPKSSSPWEGGAIMIPFMILGWLITAIATMLGAQFWFDTLKRFVAVRSSGEAPSDKPKPANP